MNENKDFAYGSMWPVSHIEEVPRRQRVPSVADEVTANIAEYAVMVGLAFETAHMAAKYNYQNMLARIHGRAVSHV